MVLSLFRGIFGKSLAFQDYLSANKVGQTPLADSLDALTSTTLLRLAQSNIRPVLSDNQTPWFLLDSSPARYYENYLSAYSLTLASLHALRASSISSGKQ